MPRVLIYGASIVLAGLTAQLETHVEMQVCRCEALADVGDLAAFDAVLVDLNDTRAADVLALLRARPDLKIIGVNAATGALTVLAGQVYLAQTLDEVVACLE